MESHGRRGAWYQKRREYRGQLQGKTAQKRAEAKAADFVERSECRATALEELFDLTAQHLKGMLENLDDTPVGRLSSVATLLGITHDKLLKEHGLFAEEKDGGEQAPSEAAQTLDMWIDGKITVEQLYESDV